MHFLIAGSSGFLGSRLVEGVRREGHTLTRLTRSATGEPDTAAWAPYAWELDRRLVEEADVVVNLAGSPTVGNPHSRRWAGQLEHSRVATTRLLAEAIAASERKPALLAGNGISFYGDQDDRRLTESAPSQGQALLTRVTRAWQQATVPAAEAGARVCVLRTAPVLDRRSMPMRALIPLFKAGLGGPLGSGRQYFPCITARDWVGAVLHLTTSTVSGPVNLCLPETPTNAEFTRALADAVHRPAILRVPGIVLEKAAGPMAPELLGSMRGVPQVLLDDWYSFSDPDVRAAVNTALSAD